MNEIWKKINDKYEVSNFGNIKSLKNNIILKPYKNKQGYLVVNLSKRDLKSIHRLVAQAFIPNPNNFRVVKHLDNNKTNNHVDNLQWDTHLNNSRDAWNDGLCENTRLNGHKNGKINGQKACSIPVVQLDKNFKFINKFKSIKEAERNTKIHNSIITNCCKKRNKTGKGFIWMYEKEYKQFEEEKLKFAINTLKSIVQPNGYLLENKIKLEIEKLEQRLLNL